MPLNLLRRTFLVVDDLDAMRTVTVNQLRTLGCDKITAVRSGEEALRRLRVQRVDAVISSWNMEGMSGLDLLRIIRADPKLSDLPFLMITAEAERHHVQEIILAGVNSLLVKPYSVGGLSTRIEKMLADADRAAALAELRRSQSHQAANHQQMMRDEMDAIARQTMAATLADVMSQLQDLAHDTALPPRQAEQIRHAGLAAQQALDWVALTDEIKRLDAASTSPSLEPVNLGELLRERVEQAREVYANKQLQVVVDTDTPVGIETPMAEVNLELCHTLFHLWLRIACDAAPPHSRVHVSLKDELPLRVLIDYELPLTDAQLAAYFNPAATAPGADASAPAPEATPGAYVAQRLARSLGGQASVQALPSPATGANGADAATGAEGAHSANGGARVGTQIIITVPRHAFSPPPLTI